MSAVVVDIRDVTLDPGDLRGHSGQKPRAQAAACRTGRGPSPATCRQSSVFTGMGT